MKAPLIVLLALSAHSLAFESITKPVTDAEMAAKQSANQHSGLASAAGAPALPIPRPDKQSIINQSQILHDGVHWTLVPIGAVLFIPEILREKVSARPVGTLLPWSEFLALNPSWITTHETSFEQAAGQSPIPEASTEFWAKRNSIVVAVHQGGPISVAR